jgi:flagellum-specific peptidoglycan hydrolase FlgJ
MTKEEFIAVVRPAIRKATPDAPGMARTLILAHAALETGWGGSTGFKVGNALFNITKDKGSRASFVVAPDEEYAPDGTKRKILQNFLIFGTLEDSVRHYLGFIKRPRYGKAFDELMDCKPEFVITLGEGGYYTLPVPQYFKQYVGVLDSVEKALDEITNT